MIVIGNSAVGKSCLMQRFLKNEFADEHEVTLGVEFGSLTLKMEDTQFKLQIWDTAGQESFRSITKIFYKGAHAVLMCYDAANAESFKSLEYWYKEIKGNCETDVIVVLIATKCDKTEQRQVTYEEGLKFQKDKCSDIGMFFETSSKTGHNVEHAFITVAKTLYMKHKNRIEKDKYAKQEKAQRRRLQKQQIRKN